MKVNFEVECENKQDYTEWEYQVVITDQDGEEVLNKSLWAHCFMDAMEIGLIEIGIDTKDTESEARLRHYIL